MASRSCRGLVVGGRLEKGNASTTGDYPGLTAVTVNTTLRRRISGVYLSRTEALASIDQRRSAGRHRSLRPVVRGSSERGAALSSLALVEMNDPSLQRDRHGLRPIRRVELFEDILDVRLDRAAGGAKALGDFLAAQPRRDAFEHLGLESIRNRGVCGWSATPPPDGTADTNVDTSRPAIH